MRFLIILLFPATAMAGNYCFCPSTPASRQIVIIKPVQTITRQVSLESPKPPTIDVEGILAEARAMRMALEAIPNRALRKPTWKEHRFTNNVGKYQATAQAQRQVVKMKTISKRLVGVVNTSFRFLPDGSVDFNTTREQQEAAGYQQQQYQQQQQYESYETLPVRTPVRSPIRTSS